MISKKQLKNMVPGVDRVIFAGYKYRYHGWRMHPGGGIALMIEDEPGHIDILSAGSCALVPRKALKRTDEEMELLKMELTEAKDLIVRLKLEVSTTASMYEKINAWGLKILKRINHPDCVIDPLRDDYENIIKPSGIK